MGKIIEGHSFDEYQKKYGKKFNDGKLQVVKLADKDRLDSRKTYWLIKGNNPGYYQVSNLNYIIPIAIAGTAALAAAIVIPCVILLKPKGDVYHTIKFVSDGNCTMHEVVAPFDEVKEDRQFKEGETAEFIIVSNDNYKLPTASQVSFATPDGEKITDGYSYNHEDGKLSVVMNQDVIVTASATKVDPTDCTINLKNSIPGVTITPNVIKPSEISGDSVTLIIGYENEEGYYQILPDKLKSIEFVGKGPIEGVYEPEYDYKSANIIIEKSLITVGVITIDLDLVDWYKNQDYIDGLAKKGEKDKSFITVNGGITHPLKVNGLNHTVRLIGTKEDKDKVANDISTTWEFANLISDDNGCSLATQWNDTNEITSNYNYLNSSVRYALNKKTGEGGCDHILWAQKEATAWSTNPLYKNKSVLDMLGAENDGFVDALKTPSKNININYGNTWEEKTVEDELFLLSPAEMGRTGHADEEATTATYSYYNGATNPNRVKKQVNNEESYNPSSGDKPTISYVPESGQVYTGSVNNCAGYNKTEAKYGGNSWLRSPRTNYDNNSWGVGLSGLISNVPVCSTAYPVAPAFCI